MKQWLIPARVSNILNQLQVSKSMMTENGWSNSELSENMRLTNDGTKIVRSPVWQSSDGARTKNGYSHGLHVWEITWLKEQRGTCASIGVSTVNSPLQEHGYKILLGQSSTSWGWDINNLELFHCSKFVSKYPYDADFHYVPNIFYLVLDMDEGTLAYIADDKYLGVAFTGLKGMTLYPMVSCVWGGSEIGLKYIGGINGKLCLPCSKT